LILLLGVIQVSFAQRFNYQDRRITVGIRVEPPFVLRDDEVVSEDENRQALRDVRFIGEEEMKYYDGLSIDLWESIAQDLDISFEYRLYESPMNLLRSLQYNEIDIAINPWEVSGTRLQVFEIPQPFFISSLGVATSRVYSNQFQLILSNMFSLEFAEVIFTLFSSIVVFGTIMWIIEREYNSEQFNRKAKGILDGIWWSAVTLATVGYGDKVPKTAFGRVVATLWMFTTIITISSLTATITSSLTVNRLEASIENVDDLKQVRRIGTVSYTLCEDYLKAHNITPQYTFDTPLKGLQALAEDKIDVFVFDKPVMRYLVNEYHLDSKIRILPITFNKQYRGFLIPKNSELVDQINPELVDKISKASWQRILKKYGLDTEE